MTPSAGGDPAVAQDRILEVFGETVIIRRDPAGQPIDAGVVAEIVPPGVGAPLHRHSREDEVCYVVEGAFRIWLGSEPIDVEPGRGGAAAAPSSPHLPEHQRWQRFAGRSATLDGDGQTEDEIAAAAPTFAEAAPGLPPTTGLPQSGELNRPCWTPRIKPANCSPLTCSRLTWSPASR
jgi:hypothetical protein